MRSFAFSGLIKISIAPLYEQPNHRAELGSQAMMGTVVSLLDETAEWFQVGTPDGYHAWCEKEAIIPLSGLDSHEKRPQLMFTARFGIGFKNEDLTETLTDLYAGCRLYLLDIIKDKYKASLPDGQIVYFPVSQAMELNQWRQTRIQNATEILKTSRSYLGTSYLWGGTSPVGVDCSGFTKLVYEQHGIGLKRNASQQCLTGLQVDLSDEFTHLQAGDLVFFAKKATGPDREKITHVGIYIGGLEYIHASAFVQINSFDPTAKNYHSRAERFVRASRILGQVGTDGILKL